MLLLSIIYALTTSTIYPSYTHSSHERPLHGYDGYLPNRVLPLAVRLVFSLAWGEEAYREYLCTCAYTGIFLIAFSCFLRRLYGSMYVRPTSK